jgi:hypothetical protein
MKRPSIAIACALTHAGLMLGTASARAQGADAVETFRPGTGQNAGQGPAWFPANVLGLPDTSARRTVASVDPGEILSLGLGGEIVLRFDSAPIVDGPGVDFTVFENAFVFRIGQRERVYAEPAEVAVSRDGSVFVSFPHDFRTLAGCAGVTPTNGDANPLDPTVSGGDAFDLALIGVDSVRYVRITDLTAIVADDPTHAYWDPTLSGFDLDAVVAIPLELRGVLAAPLASSRGQLRVVPNPATEFVEVTTTGTGRRSRTSGDRS